MEYGDLFIDAASGVQYRYVSDGKLSRTQAPTLIQQKRERELAKIKASQEREKTKAEEKKRRDKNREEQARLRDIERIKKAKAQKQAAELKKAEAKAKRLEKLAAKSTKGSINNEAKAGQVKVVHIGNSNDFGVFPESCFDCTTHTALVIGTKAMCEAERERRNAKLPANGNATEESHGAA
jgi:predicted Zn-dependent protease